MFVYTGYLDESGTHGDSPILVMGGMLGRDKQWEVFQSRFNLLRRKHKFSVLHAKNLKARSGEFKGWTDQQVEHLVWDLQPLFGFGLAEGVAVAVDKADFHDRYRKGQTTIGKVRLDSAYGLSFRLCLAHFMFYIMKRKFRGKLPRLHIVVEAGHPNIPDASRIFNETRMEFEGLGFDALMSFAEVAKEESPQLMLADFIANTHYHIGRRDIPEPSDVNAGYPLPPGLPKNPTAMTFYKSTADALEAMRESAVRTHEVLKRAKHKGGGANQGVNS